MRAVSPPRITPPPSSNRASTPSSRRLLPPSSAHRPAASCPPPPHEPQPAPADRVRALSPLLPLPLSVHDWVGYRCPTQGAENFADICAGEERPPDQALGRRAGRWMTMAGGGGLNRSSSRGQLPPQELLDDLCSRFLLNVPKEELESFERILFLLEQAPPLDHLLLARRPSSTRSAKILRKTLGGGMRQVGVLCAAAHVAVRDNVGKLADDHRKAKALAEPKFGLIDKPDADTNDMISEKLMVQINLNEGIEEDIPPSQYTTRCEEKLTMTQAAISREAGPPGYDPGENCLQDFVHVWHPHNQNVGATGSGLSGVATVSSTLGVLRAYSPNSTSASSSNLSTVHMGGLTCITQPTTELGSEDTVIAQFLSNPGQVGPSESPVLFSGTVGAASTFSPLASNDLPEISAMVPPPSTSADRLGSILPEPLNIIQELLLPRTKNTQEKILLRIIVAQSLMVYKCEEKLTMTQAAISREAGPPGYDPGENFLQEDGLLHTACGTPNYVAPEVLADKGYDGMAADVWSCGIILFVLMAGYLPFDDANLMRLYKLICHATFSYPPWFSFGARKFIKRILDPNPDTRIKIAEFLEDEWFKKGYKPPHFEQGEDVNLDDVDAALIDSEVLHPQSMRPDREGDIPVRVKNSYNPKAPGTLFATAEQCSAAVTLRMLY
ncbi:hypothetical protein ZEAMMB73_Zm00001d021039 [Zea mays]|uniref:Protein kinase domain-containing protein n=1 Tax=Zea mays TaxID=4577 RepID=A0A1D6I825_MAIZE|nr:hypothetical protein ZEAMMB73_Zm00001d021039 [Zea mays]